MDFFQILWTAFSLETRSVEELIEISMRVDAEKSQNGLYANSTEDFSIIASIIVALQNEPSTNAIGNKLYNAISTLIVKKNASLLDTDGGKEIFTRASSRDSLGTFRIRQTRSGCRFDLVASNGEILATSESYSSLDSCANGIKSVQKNASVPVEDQTKKDYSPVRNPKYEVYLDKAGEVRFRLKLANGQIILVSPPYMSREVCLAAIERMKISANTSDVEKK
jgi:uncharacterized protein YegP (UPF0339 family)